MKDKKKTATKKTRKKNQKITEIELKVTGRKNMSLLEVLDNPRKGTKLNHL